MKNLQLINETEATKIVTAIVKAQKLTASTIIRLALPATSSDVIEKIVGVFSKSRKKKTLAFITKIDKLGLENIDLEVLHDNVSNSDDLFSILGGIKVNKEGAIEIDPKKISEYYYIYFLIAKGKLKIALASAKVLAEAMEQAEEEAMQEAEAEATAEAEAEAKEANSDPLAQLVVENLEKILQDESNRATLVKMLQKVGVEI